MFLLLRIYDYSFGERYQPCHRHDLDFLKTRYSYTIVAASEYADAIRAAYRLLAKEGR